MSCPTFGWCTGTHEQERLPDGAEVIAHTAEVGGPDPEPTVTVFADEIGTGAGPLCTPPAVLLLVEEVMTPQQARALSDALRAAADLLEASP